jgi:glutathione S-transferase
MLQVLTADTPNGIKIPIALEELGVSYQLVRIDLARGDQKRPAFLADNPNGRIPVLIDDEGPGGGRLSVFESGAILLYLAEKYGRLLPVDPRGRLRALEYLFFQVSGVGPMFGQAGWFKRSAPEPVTFAIERYQNEARRLAGVLEVRLAQSKWLAGAEYSIADIANFGWLRVAGYAGVSLDDFPAVSAWVEVITARLAVLRALERVAAMPSL